MRRLAPTTLMYHGLATSLPEDAHRVHVSAVAFERQVAIVHRLSQEAGFPVAEFTFDDGFRSQLELAAPVLSYYNYPATLFLTTSWADAPETFRERLDGADALVGDEALSWEEVRELHERGWHIESHGVTHRRINRLAADEVEHELSASAAAIASHVGRRPRRYAYPFGAHNAAVRRRVGRHYDAAYGVSPGRDPRRRHPGFALPRVEVGQQHGYEDAFAQLVLTAYPDPPSRTRARLRRVHTRLSDLIASLQTTVKLPN